MKADEVEVDEKALIFCDDDVVQGGRRGKDRL